MNRVVSQRTHRWAVRRHAATQALRFEQAIVKPPRMGTIDVFTALFRFKANPLSGRSGLPRTSAPTVSLDWWLDPRAVLRGEQYISQWKQAVRYRSRGSVDRQ